MATPAWLAASVGKRGDSGLITQFLGGHNAQWIYTNPGAVQTQQATGAAVYQSLQSGYLSQTITTGSAQTAIGQVSLQISTVGGSAVTATISPLTVSLFAAASGLPVGAPLASAQLAEPYVYAGAFWLPVPLLASGLSPSSIYCLVVTGAGSPSAYYVWQQSNQASGAATSPDGSTWTPQSYGLMYQVYGTGGTGQIQSIVADDGARITNLTWSGTTLTGITEYTIAQDGTTLVSSRTLTYASNGLLKAVG